MKKCICLVLLLLGINTFSQDHGAGNGGDISSIQAAYMQLRVSALKNDYTNFANSEAYLIEYGHLNISSDRYIQTLNESKIEYSNEVLVDKLNQVRNALNFKNGKIIFSIESNYEEMVNSKEFAILFQHEHLNLLGIEIDSYHESIKMWPYLEAVTITKVNTFKKVVKDFSCKVDVAYNNLSDSEQPLIHEILSEKGYEVNRYVFVNEYPMNVLVYSDDAYFQAERINNFSYSPITLMVQGNDFMNKVNLGLYIKKDYFNKITTGVPLNYTSYEEHLIKKNQFFKNNLRIEHFKNKGLKAALKALPISPCLELEKWQNLIKNNTQDWY